MPGLDTPELVHVAMLRGTIAQISMSQCAHVWGDKMVEAFNRWDELRGDIKLTSDILGDFAGEHVWEQAQNAVEHIEYLKRQTWIAENNEKAAFACMEQDRAELMAARSKLRLAKACLEEADPVAARVIFGKPYEGGTHDQTQEQGQGAAQQEREEDEPGQGHAKLSRP